MSAKEPTEIMTTDDPNPEYARINEEIYQGILDFEEKRNARAGGGDVPPPSDDDAPQRPVGDGVRPEIVIGPDVERVVAEAERALLQLGGIYVRGRRLARVVRDHGRSDWMRRPDGTPVIVQIRPPALLEHLSRAALWISVTAKGKLSRTLPPSWLTAAILEREEWTLPHIEGVAESPVFRADGTILAEPGYDPETRLIYDPRGTKFPTVPERPTHAQATQALADLLDPFSEFPFVDDSARAATAALILSIVARTAIPGNVPMFSAQAPTPGSGKGLLIGAASMIAIGRLAPLMAQTADEEENRKRLLALAIESPRLIVIDNVEGTFGSPTLAMALTTGEVTDRKLGVTETVSATLRSVWAITGNNVQFRSDFGRRVVPIDLDPQQERPENRVFQRKDLMAYIEDQRPWLITAALTVLRAFVVAGRPDHGLEPVGSYEHWDRLVRASVIWAGGVDPMGGVKRIQAEADDDVQRIRVLLNTWQLCFGRLEKTVNEAVKHSTIEPELREAMSVFCKDGQVNSRAIGYALRKNKGRIVGGLRLQIAGEDRNGNTKWVVESSSVMTTTNDDGDAGDAGDSSLQ